MSGSGWQQQAFHRTLDCSVRRKISDDIHLLVRDADNINSVISNQLEDNMRTLWKAVIAFSYVRAVFAQLRIFR